MPPPHLAFDNGLQRWYGQRGELGAKQQAVAGRREAGGAAASSAATTTSTAAAGLACAVRRLKGPTR